MGMKSPVRTQGQVRGELKLLGAGSIVHRNMLSQKSQLVDHVSLERGPLVNPEMAFLILDDATSR
jgi:hypothetical protein